MEEGTSSNCNLRDCGLFAVDCVVVCCCPPCLLLQVTVYICIRLPRSVAVKSKRFMLKKLSKKRSKKDKGEVMIKRDMKGSGIDGGRWWLHADRDIDITSSRSPLLFMDAEKSIEEEILLILKKEKGIENWMSCVDLEGESKDHGERRVWEDLVVEEGLLWFGSFWGIPG